MWKALARAGETVGRCRVERLMRTHGLQGAKRRGKPWRTTTPDPRARRRPDLVQRDFAAAAPDRLWVGGLHLPALLGGRGVLRFVIDAFSRVVGWQFAGHMRTDLVLDALRMAITSATPAPTSSWSTTPTPAAQYTSIAYTDALAELGILASVGSVGDAYDNAWPRASSTASRPS